MKFTKYYDDDDDDDYLPTEEEHENDENLMIPSKILLDGCASMQHILNIFLRYKEMVGNWQNLFSLIMVSVRINKLFC